MPYLEQTNAKIYYETWGEGDGPWLTLVNGFTRSLTDLRAMGHHFTTLGWRVVSLDNRGAGKTESSLDFTSKDSVNDILAVWDELKIARTHLAGLSYGGFLSMNAALAAPTKVISLVLISTCARSSYLHVDFEGLGTVKVETESSVLRYFSPEFIKGHKILVRALAKEMVKVYQDPQRMLQATAQRRAMGAFDITAALSDLKVPTLIIHGSDDRVVDIGAAGDMASQIPGAKFEIFTDSGHLIMAETPKRLYDTMEHFVLEVQEKDAR